MQVQGTGEGSKNTRIKVKKAMKSLTGKYDLSRTASALFSENLGTGHGRSKTREQKGKDNYEHPERKI